MSDQNLDYAAIQDNVEKGLLRKQQVYRRLFFWMHLLVYVVTMLAVWGVVSANSQLRDVLFNSGPGAAILVILPTIMWTAAVLFHVASLYFESETGQKALREQLLARDIGEELLRNGLTINGMLEKPKRHAATMEARRTVLSDDGELTLADERHEQRAFSSRANNAGNSKQEP
jgi:hypothetical protein